MDQHRTLSRDVHYAFAYQPRHQAQGVLFADLDQVSLFLAEYLFDRRLIEQVCFPGQKDAVSLIENRRVTGLDVIDPPEFAYFLGPAFFTRDDKPHIATVAVRALQQLVVSGAYASRVLMVVIR